MTIRPLGDAGVLLFEPKVFGDPRGFFTELWHQEKYREAGIAEEFVQLNLSGSERGVLRGLHYQEPNPQGKLVTCLQGEVLDVAVDIRKGSPTFGKWWSEILSAENHRQLYVPPGFAHGFAVRSVFALFAYLVTAHYDPTGDRSIQWNDPELGVEWGVEHPSLSAKDLAAPLLKDAVLPNYVHW
ncbi:dTDP-4-dehydrorhamnose 3,5-epimerase [bacterium]|nr:MAG: dTDP-4-dehydrorhamnose 3,5-epimerase [bacterium]